MGEAPAGTETEAVGEMVGVWRMDDAPTGTDTEGVGETDGVCRLDEAPTGTDTEGVGVTVGVRRLDEAGGAVLYSEELGHRIAVEYSLEVSTGSIGVA